MDAFKISTLLTRYTNKGMVMHKISLISISVAAICAGLLSSLIAQDLNRPIAEKQEIIAAISSQIWDERNRILTTLDSATIVDPDVSAALFQLLTLENDYYSIQGAPSEAWGEYYWYLVSTVGKTQDDRAIPVLVASIYGAGGIDAAQGLAGFGEKGVFALLAALERPGDSDREIVLEVITLMHVMNYIESSSKHLSPEIMARIKSLMIRFSTDDSYFLGTRKDAIIILGHIDDPEVVAHLENMAQSDPDYVPNTIGGTQADNEGYHIREEAKKSLEKIQKMRQQEP